MNGVKRSEEPAAPRPALQRARRLRYPPPPPSGPSSSLCRVLEFPVRPRDGDLCRPFDGLDPPHDLCLDACTTV